MLADLPLDAAVCSGMPRTLETARIVLGARAVALEEEPRLREARAGRLREVRADSVERIVAYAYEGAHEAGASFIGGETWEGFAGRVRTAWNDLMRRPDWLHLLIVAHDGVNRVLLSDIAGGGLAGMRVFEQDPACINIIDVDIDIDAGSDHGVVRRAMLRAVNISPYNPAKTDLHQTVMEKVFSNYRRDA
jgi:probable phosphoglycerate mutase